MPPKDKTIAFLFARIRKRARLNQAAFAEKIGVSQSAISRIELGYFEPNSEILVNTARTFANRVSIRNMIAEFLFEKDDVG